MFEKVEINNFQSHKETTIKFENGVNVLVGASDQGKSAVLRAVIWAVNNRPLGTDDIVSHWARDDKNKIKNEMSVTVTTETGMVKRSRTAETNKYELTDFYEIDGDGHVTDGKTKIFEAVNKEVPEDIQKFFSLSDVNIQQQHDSPFLLSASASDVAKFFNKIVRLDVIDIVLGNAESARRETNKKIKETENEKKELEKQLENFEWIEQAQELNDKLQNVELRIKKYDDDWNLLGGEIVHYETIKKESADEPDIKKAHALIEKIENINIDYDTVNELEKNIEIHKKANRSRKIFEMIKNGKDILSAIDIYNNKITDYKNEAILLQKAINEYTENKKTANNDFDKKKAIQLIKEIEAIQPDYNKLRELNLQINECSQAISIINKCGFEIYDYKKQLPEECPICGHSMGECKD